MSSILITKGDQESFMLVIATRPYTKSIPSLTNPDLEASEIYPRVGYEKACRLYTRVKKNSKISVEYFC